MTRSDGVHVHPRPHPRRRSRRNGQQDACGMQQVELAMTAEMHAHLLEIGEGDVSRGVRRMIDAVRRADRARPDTHDESGCVNS